MRSCLEADDFPASTQFISPALLNRARSVAAEHALLSTQLDGRFDSKTAKRAGEIAAVASNVKKWEESEKVGSLFSFIRAC